MDIHPLDVLPLTCVRGGGCCHAKQIAVTPWEIARLARATGQSAAQARDRLTTAGGTRLRNDGPDDGRGHAACSLLGAQGCTVHADRPLACRLFPLGRSLAEGRAVYHMPERHRCADLCPTALAEPRQRVGAWLQQQDVASGEVAHDAYGRLVCGLLTHAGQLADGAAFTAELHLRAALDPGRRAALLPRPWFELATAPGLPELVDDPATFVLAHAERILGAVSAGFAGEPPRAALVVATIALQLGEPLGIPAQAALAHLLAARQAAVA
jgi:Fe-S-cluster containining protein